MLDPKAIERENSKEVADEPQRSLDLGHRSRRQGGLMGYLRDLAFGTHFGAFPMIALVGFVTYALILTTATLALVKRWSKWLRRVPLKVHRRMGILAILLATLHLLMGVSAYV